VHHTGDRVDGRRDAGANRGDVRQIDARHLRGLAHGGGHPFHDVEAADRAR
jgi:hypothetical protein